MVLTTRSIFYLVAGICAVIALMAVVFGIDNEKVYPAAMAASLMFGWFGFIVP